MLIRTSDLKNFSLAAIDGDIGRCRDFLFDDDHWTVRYMEANTGKWLLGRRVLISPAALDTPKLDDHRLPVKLTKKQIEDAPPIEEDMPISRQYEALYARHFNYGYYWTGGGVWGAGPYPYAILPTADMVRGELEGQSEPEGDPHLRSANEVKGYTTHAADGDVGVIDDFILDTGSWTILYLALDTQRWLPGRKVLVPVRLASDISWVDRKLTIGVPRQAVETAPELSGAISTGYTEKLDEHFFEADPPGQRNARFS